MSMKIVNCYGHCDGQTQTVDRRKWMVYTVIGEKYLHKYFKLS